VSADQFNYTVKKVWKALCFTIGILRKGNSLAYISLLLLILEYGAACWDPYREGEINELDQVQNKVAKFAQHRSGLNWETLAQSRKIACI
jgi:hypothetical protein